MEIEGGGFKEAFIYFRSQWELGSDCGTQLRLGWISKVSDGDPCFCSRGRHWHFWNGIISNEITYKVIRMWTDTPQERHQAPKEAEPGMGEVEGEEPLSALQIPSNTTGDQLCFLSSEGKKIKACGWDGTQPVHGLPNTNESLRKSDMVHTSDPHTWEKGQKFHPRLHLKVKDNIHETLFLKLKTNKQTAKPL